MRKEKRRKEKARNEKEIQNFMGNIE